MIKILKPGWHTSVQDGGRFGYRNLGVPVSGFMDNFSAQMSNSILGNSKHEAVLELTMIGGVFQFLRATHFVISGADMSPRLNSIPIENNKVYSAVSDSTLKFGQLKSGLRAYLAIKGGFESELILDSQSFYRPLTSKGSLTIGDTVLFKSIENKQIANQQFSKLKASDFSSEELIVHKGPEFDRLKEDNKALLLSTRFQVSNLYNRMAYQLSPDFQNNLDSIITSAVLPGTVQLTPSGKLIILMRDCQTTGGYPRVLQLTEGAINLLAQKKERDYVFFKISN